MNNLASHIQAIRYQHKILPAQPKRETFEPLTLQAYVAKKFRVKELEGIVHSQDQQIGQYNN